MRNSERKRNGIFSNWLTGVAAGAMIVCLSTAALADAGDSNRSAGTLATVSTAGPIEEVNRYYLRLMTQIFDGSKDFSHTQIAGFARMRKDRQSWTMLDFGDGAVVISARDKLSASAFENISGTDLGVLYDYDSKRIAGTSPLAKFHNDVVRPHLDKAPALGSDADWSASLPAGTLGIRALSGEDVRLELSRRYFTHDGKPMVLVEYRVPVASFNAALGGKVMHWGRGFALSDPGFGTIYANVALHRSATTASDGSIRPYRFFRAAFASDDKGKPMLDIARIPQVAAFYNDFFGKAALEVIPYSDEGLAADQTLVKLAANLDIIAMSIGENGANDNGALAGAQTGSNRGVEKPKPLPQIPAFGQSEARRAADAVGARAATDDGLPLSTPRAPGMTTAAQEAVQVMGPRRIEPERPALTPEEALEEALQRQEAQKKIPGTRGGGGGGGSGGAEGGQGTGGGEGGSASSSNALDDATETSTNLNVTVSAADKSTTISSTLLLSGGKNLVSEAGSIHERAKSTAEMIQKNKRDIENASGNYTAAVKRKAAAIRANPNLSAQDFAALNRNVEQAGSVLQQVQREVTESNRRIQLYLNVIENRAKELSVLVSKTPLPVLSAYLAKFGDSPAGKVLSGVSHGLNTATSVTAVSNAANASVTDLSSGDLALTRAYGANFASVSGLTLDLVAIAGNLYAGNVAGAVSDGSALVLGSLSDIYIAVKAAEDAHNLSLQASDEYIVNLKKLTKKQEVIEAQKLKEIEEKEYGLYTKADPYKDGYDLTSPGYNPDVAKMSETHKQYLIRHNRGEAIRLGLIDPDAPPGGNPSEPQGPGTSPKIAAQPKPVDPGPAREELLRGLAKEIEKKDYPIAPSGANDKRPVRIAKPAEVGPAIDPVQQAELDREARKAQAQADLDAYQAKRLAERKAEEAAQALKPRGGPFVVSSFNTKPVTFTPVEFSGVSFDKDGDLFVRNEDGTTSLKKVGPDDFVSPTFVGPEFNAPKASGLGWTNFDDDDYPGSGEVPAFGFESMSGKIATDLSKWADWLATQDIRQLERLARTAGYPNLASALNDAANLIRLSQDKGYVKWALTPPSCGGYVGCGPSYLERWGMKLSTVKLGNILNQSRDVFSTGGLSDIAISRDQLSYMLRDFGQQDGDIVDVLVQQFGRDLFKGRVNLTNAGEAFNILLRRGVAVLTLTAVNEGAISPNTAGISIQEVTKGNASQSYSLLTGQSATLRIETNRPAGN